MTINQTNNPTLNGACNWDKRVKAEWKKFGPQLGKLISQRVVAYPGAVTTEHHLVGACEAPTELALCEYDWRLLCISGLMKCQSEQGR